MTFIPLIWLIVPIAFIPLVSHAVIILKYNSTHQDTKNLNQEPHLFRKLKFAKNRTKIANKPKYQLGSWHRTETVPKPYRKRKKRTVRYVFKNQKNQ